MSDQPKRIGTDVKFSTPVRASINNAISTINKLELTKGLPPATIVYGAAAGIFCAFALFLMIRGHFVDGLLTLLPAACFVGFAVHLLKHNQPR